MRCADMVEIDWRQHWRSIIEAGESEEESPTGDVHLDINYFVTIIGELRHVGEFVAENKNMWSVAKPFHS